MDPVCNAVRRKEKITDELRSMQRKIMICYSVVVWAILTLILVKVEGVFVQ